MIPCLLLERKIPKSRCDVKKQKQTLPPACKECLKKKKGSTVDKRLDQLIKGYSRVRRDLLEIAMLHGRNQAMLEDHKRQTRALQRKLK